MAREDFNRRRLRGMYERNRHRVSALADARDRRRDDNDMAAPRRYIVSERRTRIEGFGRGGAQVRQVVRRVTRGGMGHNRMRFSDRGVFRRGNRDRFRRDEDFDRDMRRERFRDNRDRFRRDRGERRVGGRGGEGRRGGDDREQRRGLRLGFSRVRRMRMSEERRRGGGGGEGRRGGEGRVGRRFGGEGRRGNGNVDNNNRFNRGGNNNNNNNNNKRHGNDNGPQQNGGHRRHHRGGGNGGRGGRNDSMPTRDQLDAQLDRFRTN